MGRSASYSFTLKGGTRVPYGFRYNREAIYVRFPHPTEARHVIVSTGETKENDAHIASAKIVLKHYTPTTPDPVSTTWEDAVKFIQQTPDLREDSVRAYLCALRALRTIVNVPTPNDVTVALATKFKRDFLIGQYKRSKASDAVSHKRNASTCQSYLRCLRSLWKKHFKPNGIVTTLPFAEVPYPNDARGKRVRMPSENSLTKLLEWLHQRYPEWTIPGLFVETKAFAGCRTLDLCKTLSSSLVGNVLTLTSEVTKTRSTRAVPLPLALAERLHEVKGKKWLWERSLDGCEKFRPARGPNRRKEAYEPKSWLNTVNNLFREFNEGKPMEERIRPDDSRARTITLVAASTQSVDLTAKAMGVDLQTTRHYFDC